MAIIWLMIVNIVSGWWLSPTPLKNHGVKVSWDDEIPNWMGKNVPNHQTGMVHLHKSSFLREFSERIAGEIFGICFAVWNLEIDSTYWTLMNGEWWLTLVHDC